MDRHEADACIGRALPPGHPAARGTLGARVNAMSKPGDRIGDRYVVGDEIGSGGMGVVVRATDTRLGREVALKVLSPRVFGDATARARLVREARSAAALEHVGIVHVYDVGETEEGGAYLVMELVRGESLRSLLERGGLSPGRTLVAMTEAARALAFAHQKGFIHRDVKPDNIMLREDGRAVVLDFGIAKGDRDGTVEGSPLTLTADGQLVGTPAYLSPEQASGEAMDGRSDQFALAVTTYEALTLRLPWSGTSAPAIVAAILRDDPPPPSRFANELPADVDRVLLRALAKRPEDRYPTLDAFADALESIVSMPRSGRANTPASLALTEGIRVTPSPGRVDSREAIEHAATQMAAITPSPSRTTSPRDDAGPRRSIAKLGAAVAFAAATLAGGLWAGARLMTPAAPSASAPSAPLPRPTAITDLPVPDSRSLDALAAYRAGMQASRDGAAATAVVSFRRAVELDPTMAAAWWRLADFLVAMGDVDKSREAYARAMQLRGSLTERDLAFFVAEEPVIQWTVPDVAEARRRYEALVTKYPLDAEVHATVGYFAYEGSDYATARTAATKALELDPQYGMAWMLRAWVFQAEDDEAGARAAFTKCQEISSGATNCIMNLAHIQGARGECDAMEAAAQRLQAVAPNEYTGGMYGSLALSARGAPVESIRERVEQWAMRGAASPAERPVVLSHLDFWSGDFRAAEVRADEMDALLTGSSGRSWRGRAARIRAEALVEEGRLNDAAKVADRFLKRRGSWVQGVFDNAPIKDATPALMAIARRAGAITPAEWTTLRDEWIAQWTKSAPSPSDAKDIWLARALAADSKQDADEALATMPEKLPQLRWDSDRDRAVGKLYFLAGRTDEAIPWLKREAASCLGLMDPVDHVRSRWRLGQALEQQGDKDGACKAYRFVEQRWGAAKPRSITADAAKARATKLGCSR